jgi:hypothetical protein
MQTTMIEITRVQPEPLLLRRDLCCADCGYGVVVVRAPERCPMCHGIAWLPAPRSTLALAASARLA